jgi:Tol biopolymer transport system component/DNA-binding winged helix-turn-helix (wHTH) protein
MPVNDAASPGKPISRIDLATEPAFALGSLRVFPATREIQSRQGRQIVEPRVMQGLVCLARANGAVVSRDGLIAGCWGGQVVGDDAINGCIAKVRQIAERHQPPPFMVETVPRVGYRLIVSSATEAVAKQPAPETAPMPAQVQNGSTHRKSRALMAALIVAAIFAGTIGYLLWPRPQLAVENSQPFIASLAAESAPAFSPDGTMVAYAASTDGAPAKIFLRSVAGGDPIQLTSGNTIDDMPSWSSDSGHIVYAAMTRGGRCRIMVTGVPAGTTREAGQCNADAPNGLSWQPDSDAVFFSDRVPNGGGAIYRLDLDTGKAQRVTRVAKEWELGGDGRPAISPDGKWLAYIRGISGSRKELRVRDLVAGEERLLGTDSRIIHLAWSEDSKTVLAAITIWTGTEIQAFPRDGAAPYQIYTTPANIVDMASGKGGLLAITVDNSRTNLARASAMPSPSPTIIDPANDWTGSPDLAGDGTLVFQSNRSGHHAIYTMSAGQRPQQIFSQNKDYLEIGATAWSPDGRYISFVTFRKDAIVIRVINRRGQLVSSFETSSVGAGYPTWTYDSKALVTYNKKTRAATRIEIADPRHRTSVAPPHWFSVTLRKDGVFATRLEKPGAWQIDHIVRLISPDFPAGHKIQFYKNDILFADFQPANPTIVAQPIAGGPSRVFAYAPGASRYVDDDFAVNPHTGEVVYVVGVVSDTNIDLLRLAERRF